MWMRVDGTLTSWPQGRPLTELIDFFKEHHILAAVQAQPEQTVDVRLLVDDESRVATSRRVKLIPGLELEDLLAEIERRFGCRVVVGDDDAPEQEQGEDDADEEPDVRAVTILSGSAGQAAWLARHLDEPLVVLTGEGFSTVLTEEGDSLPEPETWPEGRVVQLRGAAPECQVLAGEGEHAVGRTPWFAPVTLTPAGLTGETRALRDDLAGSKLLTELPGSSEAAGAALDAAHGSPAALLAALGQPESVARFLSGELAAHEVPDVVVVTPPNTTQTLKLVADDVMQENIAPVVDGLDQAVGDFEHWVDSAEAEHPVTVRAVSVLEVVGGVALMVLGLRGSGGWKVLGLLGGAGIAASGASELVVYQLLRRRRA